ncbi:AmmeMemoRadiSam system protein B [Candidatus Margulisiibacteriota bacterium]
MARLTNLERRRKKRFKGVLLITVFITILIFILYQGGLKMVTAKDVFESKLSNIGWYSPNPEELKAELDGYLNKVSAKGLSDVQALILPHAGYRYSGQTAAYGIKEIIGKNYNKVIIMGPSHGAFMRNQVSVSEASHYATPLGEVSLDKKSVDKLLQSEYFTYMSEIHEQEHSVQIELPFLQVALKDFSLVPVVVGNLNANARAGVARALLEVIDDRTLVVISGDFVHYGTRFGYVPFKDHIPENIEKLDMGAVQYIKSLDSQGFTNYCAHTKATICGREAIGVLLEMLPLNSKTEVLEYTTSGELTGDWFNSVSYLAIAFTGKWSDAGKPEADIKEGIILNEQEKELLLKLARNTVEYYLKNNEKPTIKQLNIELSSSMKAVMGAFVTLKKRGQLRGCIGEILPRQELYKAIIDQAINAAANDHRFQPVSPDEVKELEFEISALSQPEPVENYKDIVLGKHGIIIQKDGRSAVFLPQVAPEQGWTLEETLTHLSMKAGLSGDSWKSGMQFLVFEATVFHEE